MKKLLEQYWKEANQHKELDPLNFEIEDFTERFMYKHRNALRLFNVVGRSEQLHKLLQYLSDEDELVGNRTHQEIIDSFNQLV